MRTRLQRLHKLGLLAAQLGRDARRIAGHRRVAAVRERDGRRCHVAHKRLLDAQQPPLRRAQARLVRTPSGSCRLAGATWGAGITHHVGPGYAARDSSSSRGLFGSVAAAAALGSANNPLP